MAGLPTSALMARMSVADDLLNGLDIEDEESREFLKSLVVAGQAPEDELAQLYEDCLQRGVDEWDMLLECATSIKNQVASPTELQDDAGVVPYVAYILSGGAASDQAQSLVEPELELEPEPKPSKRKRKVSKRVPLSAVSHFWESADEALAGSGPPVNPHEHGLGHDVQTASDSLVQAAQPSSAAPKKEGKKSSKGKRRQRPESNDNVTASSKAQSDPLKENTDLPLISDQGPDSLLDLKLEIEDVLAEGKIKSLFADVPRQKKTAQSPYFTPAPSPKKPRLPRGTVSSIPFPPLSASRFGLIQEELAGDAFQLLVAVTFLIRTTGRAAIPVFRQFIDRFPTPAAVAEADPEDIIPMIRHLGLSAIRLAAMQKYARKWLESPPRGDFRYGVRNYPKLGDARNVKAGGEYGPEGGRHLAARQEKGSEIDDDSSVDVGVGEAPGSAWEIGHITQGPYAIDSWRIFCRDALLGRAEDWMGKGREPTFQPEWMRVLPADKELRACLRWMWMHEGWEWDPVSGERVVLREEMRKAVDEGKVGYDDHGGLVILP